MPIERNDQELIASRNNVDLAASRNGELLLSPGGRPHLRISGALPNGDTRAGWKTEIDAVIWTFDPGTATSMSVAIPDPSDTEITNLATRSFRQTGFSRPADGAYPDLTAVMTGRNASGAAIPVSATIFRYVPIALSVARQSDIGSGLTLRKVFRVTCQARPFPTDFALSPEPVGDATNRGINKAFAAASQDDEYRRHIDLHFRPGDASETFRLTCSNQDSEGQVDIVVPAR